GQALDGRVHRRPLGHGPRAHHTSDLEAKVEMPASARVLLDDERARADAAKRELLVALDARILHRDAGAWRCFAQEREERLDGGGAALRVQRRRAVPGIAHPAQNAELPCALLRGVV